MAYADDNPGYKLVTEDAARNWIIGLVAGVDTARQACDVRYPDDQARTVREQQRAYRAYLLKHGAALGTTMALHRAGLLGDIAYNELRQQVLNTLVPTVVGN